MLGGVGDSVAVRTSVDPGVGSAVSFPRQVTRDDVETERISVVDYAHVAPRAAWFRARGFHLEVALSLWAGAMAVLLSGVELTPALAVFALLAVWALANFYKGAAIASPLPQQLRTVSKSVLWPLAAAAGGVGFLSMSPAVVPPATATVLAAASVSATCRALRWRLQAPIRVLLVGDSVAIAQAVSRWKGQDRVLPVAGVLVEPDLDEVPEEILGVPTVTGLAAAPAIIDKFKADLVVVSPGPGFTSVDFRHLAWSMEQTKATLGVMGVLDSVAPHRITPGLMKGATINDVRLARPTALAHLVKSVFDRVAAAALLVVVAPLLLVMAAAVRLDSRGKAFFMQPRVGLHGRHFNVYKMRTMVENAEEIKGDLADENEYNGILFKMRCDPRITRIGAVLRKYSLDELPQLVNVVRGEMSLVGPRPSLPSEVEVMDSDTLRRLAVKPGITGLTQVSGRSDLSWDEASALDMYYADNWSLSGDCAILIRTIKAVVGAKGAY